ncbi:MAG: App1 family protein [Angustibacter sp.]
MSTPPPLHRAARTEDALNRALARLLFRRGWRPRVIAYAGYGTDGWVRVLARVLLSPPGVGDRSDVAFRGWRHFVSAKLGGVPVAVDVAGERHVVESARGGYVDVTLPADLPPGWATAELRIASGQVTEAPLRVVGPDERLGVISDVDDTVLVTALPRPFLAFWNTFVRREESRRPVPGMAELYRTLTRHDPGAFVVYVSTGAWNLAPALQRFLRRRGFPDGPLLLTDWGPTPEGWFRSGQAHKRATLRRLLDELPQLRWVLVGDDGQHDPTLYDELVWARPERVRLVVIRQLGLTEQVLTHGTPAPLPGQQQPITSGSDVPWLYAPTGHGLVREVRTHGMADDETLRP